MAKNNDLDNLKHYLGIAAVFGADFAFWTYIIGFLIGLGLFIWLCVTGP
jgi:hypothetical protein